MIYHPKPQLGTPYIPGHPLGPAGGLVAQYVFRTPRSDTLYDWTNNRNDGSLSASMSPATDWPSSGMGTALDFDRADGNNYVHIPDAPMQASRSALTVEVLFYLKSAHTAFQIVWSGEDGVNADQRHSLIMVNAAEQVSCSIGNAAWLTASVVSGVISVGIWYHFVMAWDDGTDVLEVYQDGISIGTDTLAGPVNNLTASKAAIGYRLCGTAFPADIQVAKFAIYDCALSINAAKQLSADPYCMFQSETKPAWWWDAMAAPPAVGNWPLLKTSQLGKDLFRAGIN